MARTLRRNGPPPGGFISLCTPPKRTRSNQKATAQPSLPLQPSPVAAAGLEAEPSETSQANGTGDSPAAILGSPPNILTPAQKGPVIIRSPFSYGGRTIRDDENNSPNTRQLIRDLSELDREYAAQAVSSPHSTSSDSSLSPIQRPIPRRITFSNPLKSPPPHSDVSAGSITRAERFSSIDIDVCSVESNESFERLRPVSPTSKMNALSKRARDENTDDADKDADEEPALKRRRQEQSQPELTSPVPTTPKQRFGGILGSFSRLGNSITKRIFSSAPAHINAASHFASQQKDALKASPVQTSPSDVSKTPSRLSSLFDQEPVPSSTEQPATPAMRSRPQHSSNESAPPSSLFSSGTRSPLTPRPNIPRARNGTPGARKRPPTAQEIIAANPNYIPRTPEQNREILYRLRNPPELIAMQKSSNAQNMPPSSVDPSTTQVDTSPKKRKHDPGPGFSMAAAYLTDGEEGYKDYYGSDTDSDDDKHPSATSGQSPDRMAWSPSQNQTLTPTSNNIFQIDEQNISTPVNDNTSLMMSEISPPRTALRNGQPRSALKKTASIAPTDGERSLKRVKFGSPIEQPQTLPPPPPSRRVGLARNRKFGAYNIFVDNELSQVSNNTQVSENSVFSDNSVNRETTVNTVNNTPYRYSHLQSVQGFSSHTPVSPPKNNLLPESLAKTPETENFTPRPHNPTPGTFCLPDDFGDSSLSSISDENSQPTITKDLTPAFDRARAEALKHKPPIPSRLSEVSDAPTLTAPTEEWDFGQPQTYVEAGIIGQEALDIVNQYWNEDDTEDAGVFFKRGFARYCQQIDEYEGKGFQIEVDC